MKNNTNITRIAKRIAQKMQAGRASDPRFYGNLGTLPNPDPMLRAMGQEETVHAAIMSDAHVIGEIKSMRSAFLKYQRRVVLPKGDWADNAPERQAQLLCEQYLQQKPGEHMSWDDLIWSMASAVLHGRRQHELVWGHNELGMVPTQIADVPNRRFVYNNDSAPRLLTREQPVEGIEVEPYKYIYTRHMPSYQNPYGIATLNAVFWPYTFKHGGFRFFYEFTESFGLPFPVGKYPAGTSEPDQQELIDALVRMVDEGVAAIPDTADVDLLESKTGSNLPQLALIELCNKEISKALTSQTLATDIDGAGSRAASETHKERQNEVNEADRNLVISSVNEIFAWITRVNLGWHISPPVLEFYKDKVPTKDRAEIYETASRIGKPSLKAFHDEMNIPMAEDDDDLLAPGAATGMGNPSTSTNFSAPACPGCGATHEFNQGDSTSIEQQAAAAADRQIAANYIDAIKARLIEFENEGKTLAEFMEALPDLFNEMDDSGLDDITGQALQLAYAQGMTEAV